MSYPWLSGILQTTDPLFPIGSYAHSYGLEELVADGVVQDVDGLIRYLDTTVRLNLREFELPYLRFAIQAIEAADWTGLSEIDEDIGAAKLSKELRNASISQAQQRLRLIRKLRPSDNLEKLAELKRHGRIAPNHLIVYAAESVDGRVPIKAALTTWAYQSFAAPCAASLKLFRIGQEGAQTALTKAIDTIEGIVDASLTIERDFAGAFLPELDIASHRHEKAFSRLFIS